MAKTTITDIPRKGSADKDKFGLLAYERGLETFLRGAETPITVALQGEWGSGKTSLMNVLHDDLCGEDGKSGDYLSVWINTWEYSLMHNSSETLLQILYKMTKEVVNFSGSTSEELISSFKKSFTGLVGAIARNVGSKVAEGVFDGVMEALFSGKEANSIADLRENLQRQIAACIAKSPDKKGIIFFIDDLDRIDPPVAVELLELLKNIFTLEHCIFVLAIDYDVVIKGLKPKFGELTDKNEREFRSFFDKIIQVPFSMPVSQYSTAGYLKEELRRIGVIDYSDASDPLLMKSLEEAENLTIGPNPRSIKRFLNTLSLIKCINKEKKELDDNKETEQEDVQTHKLNIFLSLAIVGIQVAYPKVYQLLCLEPGFTLWDDTIASKMGVPRIDEQTKERLRKFEEFDEEWEQVLYRLCQTDRYLQNNAINISQLLNIIRKKIKAVATTGGEGQSEAEEAEAHAIKEYLQEQMSQSSVTGFSAGDKPAVAYNPGQLMRDVQWRIYNYVKDRFKGVSFNLPKVKYNGGIRTEGNYPDLKIWQNYLSPSNHKIRFQFRMGSKQIPQENCPQFMPAERPTGFVMDDVSTLECMVDHELFKEFFEECKVVSSNNCYRLWAERRILPNGKLCFALNFDVVFDNPEAFLEDRTIKTMQEVTRIFFDICFKLHKM